MPCYALLLCYDGTPWTGFAASGGARSIAAQLQAALARLNETSPVQGASRTDAQVHANGQVAMVTCQRRWAPANLARSLNHHLPPSICCRAAAAVARPFDVVRSARSKTYRYRLDAGPEADPFRRLVCWRPPLPLDGHLLQACAAAIPGLHDWRAFTRRGDTRCQHLRRIDACTWHRVGPEWQCRISGPAFGYRQVRSLIGSMVAVAHGSASLDAFIAARNGNPNPVATQQAPAHGLCLEHIHYLPPPAWHLSSA